MKCEYRKCERADGARPTARRRNRRREGLSLLEVLLALSILGVSFFAIGELVRVGARSAEAARDQTIAQILAESMMSQVSAGLIPPNPISLSPVDDPVYQDDWRFSIEIQQIDQQGLIAVRVTIQQNPDNFGRPVSYSLVRWMIDPSMLLLQSSTTSEV